MGYVNDTLQYYGGSSISSTIIFIISVYILQLVYKVIRWVVNVRRIAAVVNQVPAPKGHWFWGHMFIHPGPGEEGIAWNQRLMLKLPKYHHFYDGWWKPCVSLKHPDSIKVLLKTAEPKDNSIGGLYFFLKPWLGNGLLVSSGPKWFRNRRLLTPGFHFDILRPYMDVYHDAASKLIRKFEMAGGSGARSVEIFNPVSLCTLDVMLRCAFTYESDVQTRDKHPYVSAVKSIADLLLDRAYKPWMYVDRLYYRSPNGKRFRGLCDYVHGVADELIYSRRAVIDKENSQAPSAKKYVDFLDILLLAKDNNGEGLTHEEIRDEVDTFLFEGHDTTSSAISWILYSLAKHQDIQRKCQEEVDSVVGDPAPVETSAVTPNMTPSETQTPNAATAMTQTVTPNVTPTPTSTPAETPNPTPTPTPTPAPTPRVHWDDLSRLPYLTQCIKESLRLYPPVPAVVRELATPLALDGLTFLPGTTFEVQIFDLHHNPAVWGSDADVFRPERFHPDRLPEIDSYAFLPFSAGPRNCIGQHFALHEIKVIVARILRHFDLHVDETHKVERMPVVTMAAKNGIKLFFKPRRG